MQTRNMHKLAVAPCATLDNTIFGWLNDLMKAIDIIVTKNYHSLSSSADGKVLLYLSVG